MSRVFSNWSSAAAEQGRDDLDQIPAAYTARVRDRALQIVRALLSGDLQTGTASGLTRGTMELYYSLGVDPSEATTRLEQHELRGMEPSKAEPDPGQISSVFRRRRRDEVVKRVPDILHLLLGHTAFGARWQAQLLSESDGGLERKATVACILELLLCMGLPPDGAPAPPLRDDPEGHCAPRMGLLHMLASGGSEPDVWDDDPDPLPIALLKRLVALCARSGANVELTDLAHRATPLSWACWFTCKQGVAAMLLVGADRDANDRYGGTSRSLAMQQLNCDLDSLLSPSAPTVPRPCAPPPPGHADERAMLARRHAEVRGNLVALRQLHAGWVEADARVAAALGARAASEACEVATEGRSMLPGPALQAVADALMDAYVVCWRPMTAPVVVERAAL